MMSVLVWGVGLYMRKWDQASAPQYKVNRILVTPWLTPFHTATRSHWEIPLPANLLLVLLCPGFLSSLDLGAGGLLGQSPSIHLNQRYPFLP